MLALPPHQTSTRQVRLQLFDRAMPLAVALVKQLLEQASPSLERATQTSLVLTLSPPPADHPNRPIEGARVPHETKYLVSFRPNSKGIPPALALCLDATPPFGEKGLVLGRVLDVSALVDCCANSAALRVISLSPAKK